MTMVHEVTPLHLITDRYLVTFIFTLLQPITGQYLVTLPSYFISQKTPNTAPMLD